MQSLFAIMKTSFLNCPANALRYCAINIRPHIDAFTEESMFNFLHPRPVVDGRAVAVQIVQQKASAQLDTRTLIVTAKGTGPTDLLPIDGASRPTTTAR
jgi:hypothetical protein